MPLCDFGGEHGADLIGLVVCLVRVYAGVGLLRRAGELYGTGEHRRAVQSTGERESGPPVYRANAALHGVEQERPILRSELCFARREIRLLMQIPVSSGADASVLPAQPVRSRQ